MYEINPKHIISQEKSHLITNFKFQFQPVTQEDMLKAMNIVKPQTSSGVNKILAKVLKT